MLFLFYAAAYVKKSNMSVNENQAMELFQTI